MTQGQHLGLAWSQHQARKLLGVSMQDGPGVSTKPKRDQTVFLFILLRVVWGQDFWWWKKITMNIFSFSFFVWLQKIDYNNASNRSVFALITILRQDNQTKMKQQENKGYDLGDNTQALLGVSTKRRNHQESALRVNLESAPKPDLESASD